MEVLVLSHCYEPIGRISWQRAITLWWTDKVEIIEEYEDRVIRTVSSALKVPAVVRFLKAVRKRNRSIKFSRENVYLRDHSACAYCGRKITRREATYDHVVPRKLGGKTTWDNIVIACVPCNQRKGGRTPEQARMKLRIKPVRPKSLPPVNGMTLPAGVTMPTKWKAYLFHLR